MHISASDVFQALTSLNDDIIKRRQEYWWVLRGEAFQYQTRLHIAVLLRFYPEASNYRLAKVCGVSTYLVKKVRELGPDYPDKRLRHHRLLKQRIASQLVLPLRRPGSSSDSRVENIHGIQELAAVLNDASLHH
jgi:hypothetical protein